MNKDYRDRLAKAVECYRRRARRQEQPEGKTDSGGRWYPSEREERGCCQEVRGPSRSYPWSLFKHCCSMKHVAELFDVVYKDLRLAAGMNNAVNTLEGRIEMHGKKLVGESVEE
jgi:hypothetical protein